jgi:DnaJ homolog subfamily C member 3
MMNLKKVSLLISRFKVLLFQLLITFLSGLATRTFKKAYDLNQSSSRAKDGYKQAQKLLKQSKKKDYYKILGLSRDAADNEIKKAYRKLAKKYHPDKSDDKEAAEKKMAEINQAYEVLSNPELKQRYDMGDDPNDPTGGFGGGGHEDFFGGGHPIFFHQGGGGGPFGGGGGGGGGGPFQFNFQF